MKSRVLTTVFGLPVVFIILFFYGTIFFNILVSIVGLIGVHEACKAFDEDHHILYLIGFTPVTLLILLSSKVNTWAFLQPVMYFTLLYFALIIVLRFEKIDIKKFTGALFLSFVVVNGFYSIIAFESILPFEKYSYDGVLFVMLCLAFAWGGDTAAYFFGRAYGKRKLSPVVSPNKTVEGFLGGFSGSVIAGVLICVFYSLIIRHVGSSIFATLNVRVLLFIVLVALVASPIGVLGDLLASAIKRQCGIKDYGKIFPGHGGVLDRFDSVFLIAPIVQIVTKYSMFIIDIIDK